MWHSFFEPKKEPDDHSDVQQAFQILGGGEDGLGEVSVEKLKAFTQEAQLTIDVDKFVAEVSPHPRASPMHFFLSLPSCHESGWLVFFNSKIDGLVHTPGTSTPGLLNLS